MVCKKCGKPMEDEWLFCYYCGTKVGEEAEPETVAEAPAPEPAEVQPESQEPATATAEAVSPEEAPAPAPAEVQPESPTPAPKKKRTKLVIGIVAGVIVAAGLVVLGLYLFALSKYNKAVANYDNENYEEAKELFESIPKFKDSQDRALRSQMEIDYLSIDSLAASEEYDKIIEILDERSEYYGKDDIGKEAKRLSADYQAVSSAFKSMKAEDYKTAIKSFEKLTCIYDNYSRDLLLCRVYKEQQDSNWTGMLVNLYAIQINDPRRDFIKQPKSKDDELVSGASNDDSVKLEELLAVIKTDDDETKKLKEYAANGYDYDKAKELADKLEFEEALKLYKDLGDFMDSKDLLEATQSSFDSYENSYKAAGEYYKNGEFFKAKKEYLSISSYKDAWDKAGECVQEMPENGYKKSGNGSGVVLVAKVPEGDTSVYLKIYDESGEVAGEMFIRGGKSVTINLKGGKYTMKAASGKDWYGDIDLFGETGDYRQMMDGGESVFKLDRNYKYVLTIGGVVNGNVGTKDVGGAAGM